MGAGEGGLAGEDGLEKERIVGVEPPPPPQLKESQVRGAPSAGRARDSRLGSVRYWDSRTTCNVFYSQMRLASSVRVNIEPLQQARLV